MATATVIDYSIRGLDKAGQELERLAAQFQDRFASALRTEAEIEMTEAKKRAPVKTGALRGSGHVQSVKSGRDAEAHLLFGGPAAPYALAVHENLEAYHRVGQAKFLESTLLESVPYMAQRLAKRIASV